MLGPSCLVQTSRLNCLCHKVHFLHQPVNMWLQWPGLGGEGGGEGGEEVGRGEWVGGGGEGLGLFSLIYSLS